MDRAFLLGHVPVGREERGLSGTVPPLADWRDPSAYFYLRVAERLVFAWEWLRRTEAYHRAWRDRGLGELRRAASQYGLVELVPPELSGMMARPIWRADRQPGVIRGEPVDGSSRDDAIDLRALVALASVAFDDEEVEHWRLGTALTSVRIDVAHGTLLGGPTVLRYAVEGLSSAAPQLRSISALIRITTTGEAPRAGSISRKVERWIAELRTADALAEGASQRDIARTLFGAAVEAKRWRGSDESYRLRAQRLVRAARRRLRHPLAEEWFRGE